MRPSAGMRTIEQERGPSIALNAVAAHRPLQRTRGHGPNGRAALFEDCLQFLCLNINQDSPMPVLERGVDRQLVFPDRARSHDPSGDPLRCRPHHARQATWFLRGPSAERGADERRTRSKGSCSRWRPGYGMKSTPSQQVIGHLRWIERAAKRVAVAASARTTGCPGRIAGRSRFS